jgi:hypothetical protein
MSWVDHIEGTLPADDLRRAFVNGAKWWLFATENATMFGEERRAAEDAAEECYPGGKLPTIAPETCPDQPVADATHECILAIAVDRLARQAEWDSFAAVLLADYRRLKVQDIGSRTIPPRAAGHE